MNWALREVLGDHVQQKGSLVDPEKTRFDFSHNKPVSVDELERIEGLVNRQIAATLPVYTREVDQAEARKINTLRAVFGEKYPDKVRVVSIGADIEAMLQKPDDPQWMAYSVEFCGGTHLQNSGEVERFVLIGEEGVAKGVRRVVGISGQAAGEAVARGEALIKRVEALLKDAAGAAASTESAAGQHPSADLGALVGELQKEVTEAVIPVVVRERIRGRLAQLQKLAKEQAKRKSADVGQEVLEQVQQLLAEAKTVGGVTIVVGQVAAGPSDALRGGIDWVRNKTEASACLLVSATNDKVTLVAGMSKAAVAKGLKAGDLIKEIAPIVGGKGGGRPDMAQGGGSKPDAVPAAVERAHDWIQGKLG
ncbi:MAG: DHHA1 domain-containing protein [Phycisphaerae bacterium]